MCPRKQHTRRYFCSRLYVWYGWLFVRDNGALHVVSSPGYFLLRLGTAINATLEVVAGNGAPSSYCADNLDATATCIGVAGNALAVDSQGRAYYSAVLNDHGLLRVVTPAGVIAPCPAGFACGATGTALPCGALGEYCPVNSQFPLRCDEGYVSSTRSDGSLSASYSSTGSNGGSGTRRAATSGQVAQNDSGFTSQKPCPVGFFCVKGAQLACPAGSYGLLPAQTAAAGCPLCPLGTYGAVAGSASAAACLACPAGTAAVPISGSLACSWCRSGTSGGGGLGGCSPCAAGTSSLPGFGCVAPADGLSTTFSYGTSSSGSGGSTISTLTLNSTDPLPQPVPFVDLALKEALAVGLLVCFAAIPLVLLLVDSAAALCGGIIGGGRGCGAVPQWFLSTLRALDQFRMVHGANEGEPKRMHRTPLGGASSILAIGVVAGLAIALVIQFVVSNVSIDTSLLPTSPLIVSDIMNSASPRMLQPTSPAGAALPPGCSAQGICVHVTAMGALCGLVSIVDDRDGLISGAFSVVPDAATSDAATGLFAWVATCDNCTFGPTSGLVLRFDASCQALRVAIASVGAQGNVDIAVFTSPQPASGLSPIASLRATSAVTLSKFTDARRSNTIVRGYLLGSSSIDATPAAGVPSSVDVVVSMPLTDSYSSVTVAQPTTAVQLLSSIAGLLSLIGTVGSIYALAVSYLPTAVVEGPPPGEVAKSVGPRRILRLKTADGPTAISLASSAAGNKTGPHSELELEQRRPQPLQASYVGIGVSVSHTNSSSVSGHGFGSGGSLGSERTPLLRAHS